MSGFGQQYSTGSSGKCTPLKLNKKTRVIAKLLKKELKKRKNERIS